MTIPLWLYVLTTLILLGVIFGMKRGVTYWKSRRTYLTWPQA